MIVARYFWIIGLVFGLVNSYSLWSQTKHLRDENPQIQLAYRFLWCTYAFMQTFPWLIMGLGILLGAAANVFDFLKPRTGGWFIKLFWILHIGGALLLGFVVCFGGGAEFLVKYLWNNESVRSIKLKIGAGVLLVITVWAFNFNR
jgi:hypothetical protein